jgi:RNA polymerase sigma factor (sigma-70 family)
MDAPARLKLGANLVRLAGGDRAAFDEVFVALWPALLALARRLLDNDDDAQDAAQEALLKVFGTIDAYEPGRDALSWAFAITAFEARTLRQRRKRRKESDASPLEKVPADSNPQSEFEDAELRARLSEASELLSQTDGAEIAAYLGFAEAEGPPGPLAPARRKRRQRALSRLRSIWRSLHGFHT